MEKEQKSANDSKSEESQSSVSQSEKSYAGPLNQQGKPAELKLKNEEMKQDEHKRQVNFLGFLQNKSSDDGSVSLEIISQSAKPRNKNDIASE